MPLLGGFICGKIHKSQMQRYWLSESHGRNRM